jgi:hypothetical protein
MPPATSRCVSTQITFPYVRSTYCCVAQCVVDWRFSCVGCAASAVPCRHSGASAPPDSAAPPRHAAHQKMPRRTPVTRLSVLPSTDGYSWVAKGRGRASVRCREDIEPYSVLCRAFYKCNHAGFLTAPKSPSYESTGTAKKGNRKQPASQNEPRRGCAGTPFPVLRTRLQHSRAHMIVHAHARRRNDCV